MNHAILNDLNLEQQKAVLQADGPIIILAGAGSGKTRCITYKVAYLIQKGVEPLNILCVTFTNKAANEMKNRIQKFITEFAPSSRKLEHPTITTFHSLCAKILRIDGKYIGIPSNFLIYDQQDQLDTVKEAMKKLSISIKDYKPASVLTTISEAKNELVSSDTYHQFARGNFQERVTRIYPVYQTLLKENNALDFDDLLIKTIELFQANPYILEKYQDRFRYLLVDEYQDTNHAQYFLTKLISQKWKNICVVGDFSQSIYSWRGADFENLSKFKEDFPNTKTFSLSQNYRSTQKILDAASSVISRNTTHPVLTLWTQNPTGDEVEIYEARNEHDEAEYIIHQILNLKYEMTNSIIKNLQNSDVAILYRTNAQSRVFEEVFLHQGIPYILIGGTRFYARKEIKDILAYLKVLANPQDMISFKRIEKLGKTRLEKFFFYQQKIDNSNNIPTIELLDQIIQHTQYLELYDEQDEEDKGRLENIKELKSVALEFPKLTQFLENVALVEQESMPDHPSRDLNSEQKNAITLMTLHSAKGLEFPVVFMVGMEEGLFPHSKTLMDKHELEEERRLCYVGMTRAKSKLYLTYARRRLYFGQRSSNTVSRFLLELPEQVINHNLHYIRVNDSNVPEFL